MAMEGHFIVALPVHFEGIEAVGLPPGQGRDKSNLGPHHYFVDNFPAYLFYLVSSPMVKAVSAHLILT